MREASETTSCKRCQKRSGGSCAPASKKAFGRLSTTAASHRRRPTTRRQKGRRAGAEESFAAGQGAAPEATAGGSRGFRPVEMRSSEGGCAMCQAFHLAVVFLPPWSFYHAAEEAEILFAGFCRGSWAGGLPLRREPAMSARSLADPGRKPWSETTHVDFKGGGGSGCPGTRALAGRSACTVQPWWPEKPLVRCLYLLQGWAVWWTCVTAFLDFAPPDSITSG